MTNARTDPGDGLTRRWLTTGEAAAHLGMRPLTLTRLRIRHRGPAYNRFGFHSRLGRRIRLKVRYQPEALDHWVAWNPRSDRGGTA